MAAEQPAASAYTIHADADGTSQLAVSSLLARAGLLVAWQRPPEADCLIAHAGWLEPSVPAHLCMAGSAALRWLRESADPTALLAEASQRGMRVVLAKAADAEALRIWLWPCPADRHIRQQRQIITFLIGVACRPIPVGGCIFS